MVSDFIAWFNCLGLLNLGHFWQLFFVEWWIFKGQKSRRIPPPRQTQQLAVYSLLLCTHVCMGIEGGGALTEIQFVILRVSAVASLYTYCCTAAPSATIKMLTWRTFFLPFFVKNRPVSPVPKKNWRNCLEISQRTKKQSLSDWFLLNNQLQRLKFWLGK